VRRGEAPVRAQKREVAPATSPSPPGVRSLADWRWLAGLLAIALAAYANSIHLGIALDGHAMIADQRTHAATLENLRLIFTKGYWWPGARDRLYRPLVQLSFLVQHAISGSGTNPAGDHALNLLLHALNVWLVFALARRLFHRAQPAFFAAALWAAHPIGVDSVTNLAGRADLLATLGVLSGLVVYARVCEAQARPWASYLGLFAAGALAVFSKESGAVLPGLMLLWDLTRGFGGRAGIARRLPAYGAAAGALLVYWVMRERALDFAAAPFLALLDNPLHGAGFWAARWTAVKVIGMDLALLAWPVNLSCDRSFDQIAISGPADAGAWAALFAVAGILVVVVARRRHDPLPFWAAGFFGVALLPVSNLVVQIGATMAERFLYLPSIGFAVTAAALVYRWARPQYAAAILGTVVALYAARTIARNPDWDNDLTLTAHDLKSAPESFRLREMHGEFLFTTDPGAAEAAIADEEIAWRLRQRMPLFASYPQVPAGLGRLYGAMADRVGASTPEGMAWQAKALDVLRRGTEIASATQQAFDAAQAQAGRGPGALLPQQVAWDFLALRCHAMGRHAEAIEAWRQARAIEPANVRYYAGLTDSYAQMGNAAMAATMALEQGLVFGFTPQVTEEIARRYEAVPDGACAVTRQGGVAVLNSGCARVPRDLCVAMDDLSGMYEAARDGARARDFRSRARQAGCGAR